MRKVPDEGKHTGALPVAAAAAQKWGLKISSNGYTERTGGIGERESILAKCGISHYRSVLSSHWSLPKLANVTADCVSWKGLTSCCQTLPPQGQRDQEVATPCFPVWLWPILPVATERVSCLCSRIPEYKRGTNIFTYCSVCAGDYLVNIYKALRCKALNKLHYYY